MIVLPKTVSQDFIDRYLPNKIYTYIVTNIDKNKFDLLDEYLIDVLDAKENCVNIIKYSLMLPEIKIFDKFITFDISDTLKIGDYTCEQLIKLIDYGNSEVKGVNVVAKAFEYIQTHLGTVIDNYYGE